MHKSDVEVSINIKLRLDEDIGLAGDIERPLLVFVETKSRPILKYPYEVQNFLSEWGMIEGLSTAQHECKYDLSILEAFLIDACRSATTIVEELRKLRQGKFLKYVKTQESAQYMKSSLWHHQSD